MAYLFRDGLLEFLGLAGHLEPTKLSQKIIIDSKIGSNRQIFVRKVLKTLASTVAKVFSSWAYFSFSDRIENSFSCFICDLEPTKFVILRIFWIKFGDFCKIWILVKFEILNPKISKFEILNPNTKISNLDTKILNFDDFCCKFEENFTEIDKIGDISKFEILNPKIQNLRSLTLKSKIFDFDKIWPKIKIPPRWFIINLRFHQNSMVKIFQNWSQYGRTRVTNFFQNLKSIPKSQIHQNWLKSSKFSIENS